MKIFFSTATQNVIKAPDFYKNLVEFIKDLGVEFTRDWISECIRDMHQGKKHFDNKDWQKFYNKVKQDLKSADAIIFDTTEPSVGVGIILGMAIKQDLPILILVPKAGFKMFSKGLVAGINEPFVNIKVVKTRNDYYTYIKDFLEPSVLDKPTQKFALRLSAQEYAKLKQMAKKQRVSINTLLRTFVRKCET